MKPSNAPIGEDDHVVTPSGKRAVVESVLPDGRLNCRYLRSQAGEGDLPRDERYVVILPRLVRRIEHGIVPPPVRINGNGAGG